jgi:hypothetical protein
MRVYSRKVAELGDNVEDLEKAKSVLNTLSNSTSTINRLVRTNAYISKPDNGSAAMLEQALMELEEEWPEFKALVQKYYPDENKNSEEEKK